MKFTKDEVESGIKFRHVLQQHSVKRNNVKQGLPKLIYHFI
jgi:hypothetical protein